MKKIALIVVHFVILCWAATWCFKLATKRFPHSGSTVEQWRQHVTQITNVAELHQKLVKKESFFHRRWTQIHADSFRVYGVFSG